ncbi:MAG: hypothetical protein CM15mP25_0350 [Gammaproteobacteria bacterium]|nr:MAG: hypothetical protein CM15mP25_0350 [Gammaproteobacteria bacterium]
MSAFIVQSCKPNLSIQMRTIIWECWLLLP